MSIEDLKIAREELLKQRNIELPVKYVDLVTIDPDILCELDYGTWQGMIPVEKDK